MEVLREDSAKKVTSTKRSSMLVAAKVLAAMPMAVPMPGMVGVGRVEEKLGRVGGVC